MKNDEVINIDIWNDLHSQKYLDLYNLQKTVNEICENGEVREKWERGKQGKRCLRIPISRETEEGETEDDLPNKKVRCIEIPLP